MPVHPRPREYTLPSRVALKRKAAAVREAEAVRLRAEADDLEARWLKFKEAEDARRSAVANVAAAS
jgi:hypothetical protein